MSNKYCHHCGAKLGVIAKFCSSCGTSLSSLSNKPTEVAASKPKTFTPFIAGENGEDDDHNPYDNGGPIPYLPDGLQIEIGARHKNHEKLGSIAQSASAPIERRSIPQANIYTASFLKEFAKEAGGH